MSPSNNDDAAGTMGNDGARPLTRKELRALEKHTGGDAVPEQAYETGEDLAASTVNPEPSAAPAPLPLPEQNIPAAPEAPPSIQSDEPAMLQDAGHLPADAHVPVVQPVEEHVYAGQPVQEYHRDAEYLHDSHPNNAHPAEQSYPDEVHHDADHHYVEQYHYAPHDHHEEHGHHEEPGQHEEHGHHAPYEHHPEAGVFAADSAVSVVSKPSKKVRRRRRMLALFLTLVVFVAAIAVGAQFLKPLLGTDKPADYPGPGSGQVMVTVQPGEGTRSLATKLEDAKVVANADTFLKAITASGGTLSPGEYTFKAEMKNADAVNVLLGQDKTKVIYFALNAGLRIGESLQAISDGSGVSVPELKQLSDSPQQFGLPANAKNLEGFLAPGEHRFPLGTPAKDILRALVKATVDELVSQGITDPAKQYEAVIVASIVQAEGGQAEYGDVAGAIYNRLKPNDQTGGFLQVDSAVTYGLGTKSFNFTEAERRDKSNPYNTYANPGLPPGPIGSPGKTAIDAAAKPKANDYLFWVTINLDTKETKFSKTLAEHLGYVDQYNRWCEANVGRCV